MEDAFSLYTLGGQCMYPDTLNRKGIDSLAKLGILVQGERSPNQCNNSHFQTIQVREPIVTDIDIS